MAKRQDHQVLKGLVERLAADVRAGFRERDEIWEAAEDICAEASDPAAMRNIGRAELDRLWATQRKEEATWKGPTDCDRLDQAFSALEQCGIVCRQDFTCCGTCGVAEIGDEFDAAEARGINVRGYAFYHQQDTEAAIDGQGVYLNYGSVVDPGTEPNLAIGREIVSMLQSHGLKPRWNGSLSQRIHVPLTWRRRFVCR